MIRKALTLCIAVLLVGCAESSFELAKESRLPKWFTVPSGMQREDLRVRADYYIGQKIFFLYDSKGTLLSEKRGKRYGDYLAPKQLKNPPKGFTEGYPAYEIVIVDGIIDIIEHRRMEPVFYMTDDPAVWKELGPNAEA